LQQASLKKHIDAGALPRRERLSPLAYKALLTEVQLHLTTLVSLCCYCSHIQGREADAVWLPLIAKCAKEALIWVGHSSGSLVAALLLVADKLRRLGTLASLDQALHVYFCTYDSWKMWPLLEQVCLLPVLERSRALFLFVCKLSAATHHKEHQGGAHLGVAQQRQPFSGWQAAPARDTRLVGPGAARVFLYL
jgi:hypothetical protein